MGAAVGFGLGIVVAPSEFLTFSRYVQFLICGVLTVSSMVVGERQAIIHFEVAAVAILLSRFVRPRLTSLISAACLVFGLLPIVYQSTANEDLRAGIPIGVSGLLFATLVIWPVPEPPRRSEARRARYSRRARPIRR